MPLRPARVCRFAIRCQEKEETNDEAEEIDIYDPGDSNPYTHEYIFKHEPFHYIPDPYYPYPDNGFLPPTLVFGIGLLQDEAVAYAEEQGILGPPGSEYSATRLLLGYKDMAKRWSKLYGLRFKAATVLSRKCDIVFALFNSYSRPEDTEGRHEVRDILRELDKIFPAALERRGYFYWAMNECRMYPPGYSRLMYKQ